MALRNYNFRIADRDRALLKAAAAVEGESVSRLVRDAALAAARRRLAAELANAEAERGADRAVEATG
jgi:uncharacterized protein (DUF1778 family)